MMQPAGTQIPEATPGYEHCGTGAAGWLYGQHPTNLFQTSSNVGVCFDFDSGSYDDCYLETNINITNCGQFYVYQLPDTPACNLRYCSHNPDELRMEEEEEKLSEEDLL